MPSVLVRGQKSVKPTLNWIMRLSIRSGKQVVGLVADRPLANQQFKDHTCIERGSNRLAPNIENNWRKKVHKHLMRRTLGGMNIGHLDKFGTHAARFEGC